LQRHQFSNSRGFDEGLWNRTGLIRILKMKEAVGGIVSMDQMHDVWD
jgi:hypothetical protein